jgi:riboflavin kinase/FMN adenylyltransferase
LSKKVLQTHNSIHDFFSYQKTILTIGTFDGVHLGHQKILHKIAEQAGLFNYESVVLTFFPHPRMVLGKDTTIKLLNTLEEKEKLIEKTGIDHLIIQKFDEAFSNLSAADFVKQILVDKLNSGKIIIGYDHKFGKGRTADINNLIEFGKQFNFEVEEISAEEIGDIAVSSTKIRKALLEGNIQLVNQYLGYTFEFTGKVIEGKKIGRTIQFPTANISIEKNYKLLPKNGVYIITSKIDNINYHGMMNIGTNPTLGENQQTIEVHFFDFNQNIYNKKLTIKVLDKIREEQKFDSLEALQLQLNKDQTFSKLYFDKL